MLYKHWLNISANLENPKVATSLERSVFIPIPKKGKPKNVQTTTIVLMTQASKVMLKILQARLQQYINWISKRQKNQRSNCQPGSCGPHLPAIHHPHFSRLSRDDCTDRNSETKKFFYHWWMLLGFRVGISSFTIEKRMRFLLYLSC